MRLLLKKRDPDRIEFGIIYGGIALLMLGAGRLLPVLLFAPDCMFRGLAGIPCPTCGSTRSLVLLSHGNLLSALAMNPLTTLCLIAALVYLVASILSLAFDLPRVSFHLTGKEKNVMRTGVVLTVVAQWAYLIMLF